jgi:peptide/nickel transport system substrate-binding protein
MVACRNEPVDVQETTESTGTPAEQEPEEDEPEPPATVVVTRIIVETKVVEITVEPNPEEQKPKEITVCLGQEPETLYPYSRPGSDIAADHVRQGIYENLFTTLSYDYQARGIEKMPSLADGDAVLETVVVQAGDTVYDANSNVVTLDEGIQVNTADGQPAIFEGSPLTMTQMVVTFNLKPMVWSDGRSVTADDSVYSFELAADPATPVPKTLIKRTAGYTATSALTVVWTAVPGFMDRTYFTNIWTPYPRHIWGQYSAEELLIADLSSIHPLSHGPYVLSEWVKGDHITLVRNQHYYLADQSLPRIDTVRFRFVPNSDQMMAHLLSGQCDVATHDGLSVRDSADLLDAEAAGFLSPTFQTGTVFEHIDFGIRPVDTYARTRYPWFIDRRVRQAFTMCTDRQRMVDELLFGRSEVLHAYVPSGHPLYPEGMTEWPYDVAEANRLLDEAGFLDLDDDGFRDEPILSSPFRVRLLIALGNELMENVADIFEENLAECGVIVEQQFIDSDQYFADGPKGPLFGRSFDLAAFPWLMGIEPNCALYQSSQIPSDENNWGLDYNNETGFKNERFDEACDNALAAVPGLPEYEAGHQEALRIWSEQAPIIPLFMRLKVGATRPDVLNFSLDPTQRSELWNLFELDLG